MGRKAGILAAAMLAASTLAGCKSKPEKICEHLEAILSEPAPGASAEKKPTSPEERAKCVEDLHRELGRCQNADTIAACYVEARTLDAVATCQSKCQKKLRVKPGAMNQPAPPSSE